MINCHVRQLVDIDRSDACKGRQADCTKKDIFLCEGPILAVDISFILPVKCRIQCVPMDHLEKRSAVFMQAEGNQRMPRGKRIAIIYGIRQTPSPAVLDLSLAFSTLKSNASA